MQRNGPSRRIWSLAVACAASLGALVARAAPLAAPTARSNTDSGAPAADGPGSTSATGSTRPAPVADSNASSASQPPWSTYTPLYDASQDPDLHAKTGTPLDVFSKHFFSAGVDVTYAGTGRPLHFSGAGGGLLGAEASYAFPPSNCFLWFGAFAAYSYDFQHQAHRLAPGLELGYSFLVLDSAPLVNASNGHVGLQTRFLFALPVYHSDLKYSAGCCVAARPEARSCACDSSFELLEIEPYVRYEYLPKGFDADVSTNQVLGGLVVKWGVGY